MIKFWRICFHMDIFVDIFFLYHKKVTSISIQICGWGVVSLVSFIHSFYLVVGLQLQSM